MFLHCCIVRVPDRPEGGIKKCEHPKFRATAVSARCICCIRLYRTNLRIHLGRTTSQTFLSVMPPTRKLWCSLSSWEGMAVGSWAVAHYSYSPPAPSLELRAGRRGADRTLLGIIFHRTFCSRLRFFFDLGDTFALGRSSVIHAYKWSLAALMIFPQSVLLGMTFPLISGGSHPLLARSPRRNSGYPVLHEQPGRRDWSPDQWFCSDSTGWAARAPILTAGLIERRFGLGGLVDRSTRGGACAASRGRRDRRKILTPWPDGSSSLHS